MNGWVETHPYQPIRLQAGIQGAEAPCSLRVADLLTTGSLIPDPYVLCPYSLELVV
jgi:hypothetical protein